MSNSPSDRSPAPPAQTPAPSPDLSSPDAPRLQKPHPLRMAEESLSHLRRSNPSIRRLRLLAPSDSSPAPFRASLPSQTSHRCRPPPHRIVNPAKLQKCRHEPVG